MGMVIETTAERVTRRYVRLKTQDAVRAATGATIAIAVNVTVERAIYVTARAGHARIIRQAVTAAVTKRTVHD